MKALLLAITILSPTLLAQSQDTWTTWRGNDGLAIAEKSNPPTTWSENENLRWRVPMPGIGNSSPIIYGDLVIVTTAIQTEKDPEPVKAGERRAPMLLAHDFYVMAFDRGAGNEVWRTKVASSKPHEGQHRTSSLASNSPLTDGQHIYAYFGSRGLHCLDMDGALQWSQQFGEMNIRKQFGEGASPALAGNKLIINWDHEGDSFLIALDKKTGAEVWRQPRAEASNWSTPIVVVVEAQMQIIVAGTSASWGYDAETGAQLWSCTGLTLNTIPTPVHREGIVYLMGGYQKGIIQAIRLAGAAGNLDGTEHVLWQHGSNTSYVPSPLIYGDYVYFLRANNGVLTCLSAADGEVQYEAQKLGGMRHVYASPVGASNRVYLFSREGTGKVLALGAKYEELASNKLEDVFDGSPAIVGDAIFMRGRENLYCIAQN